VQKLLKTGSFTLGGREYNIEVYAVGDGLARDVQVTRAGRPIGPRYRVTFEVGFDREKQTGMDPVEELAKVAVEYVKSLPASMR
jgi:hypothetical protein